MDQGVHIMSKNLSSYPAALLAVLLCVPILAGAQDLQIPLTPGNSPEFTRQEQDLAKTNPGYFEINPDSVRVTLIEVKEEPGMDYVRLQEQPPKDIAGIVVTIEKIVNIASKIWDIVKENRPVTNIETKYATAYPEGVTSATQLAGWSRPKTYVYGFYAENLYGLVMIDCKYKFSFTYNGAYKGKGKYLTGVAIIPEVASVGWGYKFYMSAAVPDSTIANVGSDANPVAAMQMKLTWKMSTVLKEDIGTSVYYVEGNGYFDEIASPWKQAKQAADVKAAATLLDPANVF
jgi:hypothetical protein